MKESIAPVSRRSWVPTPLEPPINDASIYTVNLEICECCLLEFLFVSVLLRMAGLLGALCFTDVVALVL